MIRETEISRYIFHYSITGVFEISPEYAGGGSQSKEELSTNAWLYGSWSAEDVSFLSWMDRIGSSAGVLVDGDGSKLDRTDDASCCEYEGAWGMDDVVNGVGGDVIKPKEEG